MKTEDPLPSEYNESPGGAVQWSSTLNVRKYSRQFKTNISQFVNLSHNPVPAKINFTLISYELYHIS